jgi:hypothetical protein
MLSLEYLKNFNPSKKPPVLAIFVGETDETKE